jgi:hypothetical protein
MIPYPTLIRRDIAVIVSFQVRTRNTLSLCAREARQEHDGGEANAPRMCNSTRLEHEQYYDYTAGRCYQRPAVGRVHIWVTPWCAWQ